MAWSFRSGVSLTVQIVDRLRSEILRGVYPRGTAFPTVRQLAADAAVNPNTMQKALSLLESEGLLVTHGTAGRCVTDDENILERAHRLALEKFAAAVVDEAINAGISREELAEYIMKGSSEE